MLLREKSVYPTINFDAEHNWQTLIDQTGDFLDKDGLEKLTRVLGNKAKSVIIEKHYIDKDYRNTFENFHAKRFVTPPSRCVRLHFFRDPFEASDFVEGKCFHAKKNIWATASSGQPALIPWAELSCASHCAKMRSPT